MGASKPMIMKIVELVLVIVLLILEGSGGRYLGSDSRLLNIFTSSATGAYTIILIGLTIALALGEPASKKLDLYFNLVGCVLFFIIGIVGLVNGMDRIGEVIVYLIIVIVLAILFLIDTIAGFKN